MSFVVTFRISFSQSYVMEKYKLLCDVLIGCHNSRHDARQIYTYIGDVCVSVNPYTNLDIYGAEYVNQYKGQECDVSPVTCDVQYDPMPSSSSTVVQMFRFRNFPINRAVEHVQNRYK